MPIIYTDFRKKIEEGCIVRDPLPLPKFKPDLFILD